MVCWEDENGRIIEKYTQGLRLVFEMLSCVSEVELKKTSCLRFIEAWQDTVFNQSQIPVLLEELRYTVQLCSDKNKLSEYVNVIKFIEKAKGVTHTYIKFIGD